VLAVRDYKIDVDKAKEEIECHNPQQEVSNQSEAADDEGDQRIHSVVITYPYEAVPMDLFIDSVMGSVLQVLHACTRIHIPCLCV
jgi:hypothetical protein